MTFMFREFLRRENVKLAVEEQKALAESGDVSYEPQEGPGGLVIRRETGFRYLL